MTYAAILARKMNADASFVSYSGIGVWRSLTNVGELTMSDLYFSYSPRNMQEYDFIRPEPDYIIIHLGTNDARSIKTKQDGIEFKESYRAFIDRVSAKNPNSEIICVIGPMNYGCENLIKEVITKIAKENITFFAFSPYSEDSSEKGIGSHPTILKHKIMAEELYAYLSDKMR